MMYGFTQLLSATVTLAELAGHTYRVIELIDCLSDVEEIATRWSCDENYKENDENENENDNDNSNNGNSNDDDNKTQNRHEAVTASTNNNTQLHRIKLELTMDDITTTTGINSESLPSSSIRLLTSLRLCVSVPTNPNVPPVLLRTTTTAAGEGNNNNNNNNNSGNSDDIGDNNFLIQSKYHGDVPLLNNITIDVKPKGKILIRGPPGVGKSSILRTVCRLWPMGQQPSDGVDNNRDETTGLSSPPSSVISCIPPIWDHYSSSSSAATAATVKRDNRDSNSSSEDALVYLALPQAAPFRIGMQTSLFEQLTYPLIISKRDTTVRRKVKEALQIVGLPQIVVKANGLDTKHSHRMWTTMMSPGQRQLFACARVFVHMPALVLLDEATRYVHAYCVHIHIYIYRPFLSSFSNDLRLVTNIPTNTA